MEYHKITCIDDIIKLQDRYGDDSIFENLDNAGEEFTLPDLLFNYNGQQITIQHI